jgi:hypothetical protein
LHQHAPQSAPAASRPYRLEKLRGLLWYHDGQWTLTEFSGEHGNARVSAAGKGSFQADGSWRFELDGLRAPNAYGHLPLKNNDPTKPSENYFAHVDWVVNRAEALGLCMGLLPTWGDKWNGMWGAGPLIFTPENACVYGELVGRRYKDKPGIWILGGDRPVDHDSQRAIIRAMAAGLKKGDGGNHLITFHPRGGHSGRRQVLHLQPVLQDDDL